MDEYKEDLGANRKLVGVYVAMGAILFVFAELYGIALIIQRHKFHLEPYVLAIYILPLLFTGPFLIALQSYRQIKKVLVATGTNPALLARIFYYLLSITLCAYAVLVVSLSILFSAMDSMKR